MPQSIVSFLVKLINSGNLNNKFGGIFSWATPIITAFSLCSSPQISATQTVSIVEENNLF